MRHKKLIALILLVLLSSCTKELNVPQWLVGDWIDSEEQWGMIRITETTVEWERYGDSSDDWKSYNVHETILNNRYELLIDMQSWYMAHRFTINGEYVNYAEGYYHGDSDYDWRTNLLLKRIQ